MCYHIFVACRTAIVRHFKCLAYFKKTDKITLNLLLIEVWLCFQNVLPMYIRVGERMLDIASYTTANLTECHRAASNGFLEFKYEKYTHLDTSNCQKKNISKTYSLNYIQKLVEHTQTQAQSLLNLHLVNGTLEKEHPQFDSISMNEKFTFIIS